MAATHAKMAAAAAEHQEALRKVKERHLAEVSKHKRRLAQLEASSAQADAAGGSGYRPRSAMPPLPGQVGCVKKHVRDSQFTG